MRISDCQVEMPRCRLPSVCNLEFDRSYWNCIFCQNWHRFRTAIMVCLHCYSLYPRSALPAPCSPKNAHQLTTSSERITSSCRVSLPWLFHLAVFFVRSNPNCNLGLDKPSFSFLFVVWLPMLSRASVAGKFASNTSVNQFARVMCISSAGCLSID